MISRPQAHYRWDEAIAALRYARIAMTAHGDGGPLVALVRSWEALRFEVDRLTGPHRRWGGAADYDQQTDSLIREQIMPLLSAARALASDLRPSDQLTTRFLHATMAMLRYCGDPDAAYALSTTSRAALTRTGDFDGLSASSVLLEQLHAQLPDIGYGHVDRDALVEAYATAAENVAAAPDCVLKTTLRDEVAELLPHVFDEPVWFGRGVYRLRRCITAVERCFPGEWLPIRRFELRQVAEPRPSMGR